MIARIHHVRNGIEYVLQYKNHTIELRIIKHALLGRFPNYFRHKRGTNVHEISTFQRLVRNWRLSSGACPHPYSIPILSDEEQALIHEFERIADINLCLTPESVSRHRLESMQEIAHLPGIDISSLQRSAVQATDLYSAISIPHLSSGHLLGENHSSENEQTPTEELVQNVIPRMPEALEEQLIHTPESLRAAHPDMNTEGMTEEEIQENLEFVARLLNGETIPATEFPSRDSDVNDDDIDKLLKKIDNTLNDENHQSDEVCGAPTHRFIPASVMSQLWKEAKDQEHRSR